MSQFVNGKGDEIGLALGNCPEAEVPVFAPVERNRASPGRGVGDRSRPDARLTSSQESLVRPVGPVNVGVAAWTASASRPFVQLMSSGEHQELILTNREIRPTHLFA